MNLSKRQAKAIIVTGMTTLLLISSACFLLTLYAIAQVFLDGYEMKWLVLIVANTAVGLACRYASDYLGQVAVRWGARFRAQSSGA